MLLMRATVRKAKGVRLVLRPFPILAVARNRLCLENYRLGIGAEAVRTINPETGAVRESPRLVDSGCEVKPSTAPLLLSCAD